MTDKKKLPIGVQSFRKMREDDYYYVDKTGYILNLIAEGNYCFLSRPRRFGKSLLVDTFKELFLGSRELFEGLYAEDHWDWSVSYPVFAFSFAGGVLGSVDGMKTSLGRQLDLYENNWHIQARYPDIRSRFADLILYAHEKTGRRAVILVDEYDKPILDAIEDREEAHRVRDTLRDFYSVIKDNDAHLRFAFLTGVSKFSKAGIFSGLNNLRDITVEAPYSAICGYREEDLDQVFSPELAGLDREAIREWYNGYNWLGESVYNPFDVLLLFSKRTFGAYWFETGTPTFLVNILLERGAFTPNLDQTVASEMLLSTFDVDTMPIEALLFQTGYLTITGTRRMGERTGYRLGYPNREVQSALNDVLLKSLLADPAKAESGVSRLFDVLTAGDFTALEAHFKALFASIPADWHRKNASGEYEGYYASVFYSHFAALGLDVRVEDATSRGRVDMTVLFEGKIFVFEFKVVEEEPEGRALEQLISRRYADKYLNLGRPIHLIGVEFSRKEKTVCGFAVQTLSNKSGL